MTDKEKNERERDKHDAREFAHLLKSTRRETLFNNYIGVALSSYMNGVFDTCKSFKAAQAAI